MKPPYKVLHDKAMEFVDESKLAKMEGNESAAKSFLQKAFFLEKEAALTTPSNENTSFAKYLYLRSAAYLAYESGYLLDALQFTLLGLTGEPPVYIKEQLKSLQQKLHLKNASFQLIGLFTQANAKDNIITIEDETSQQIYLIQVPTEQIKEIVQNYWSAKVAVDAKVTNAGVVLLEKIRVAA